MPSVVARDLDNDPDRYSILCLEALRYADAHGAFARGKKSELKAWADSAVMREVEENAFALARAEIGASR